MNRTPDPPGSVLVEGPAVVVSGRVAWRLARALMQMLLAAKDAGQVVDPEVAETVKAIQTAAVHYSERTLAASARASATGSVGLPPAAGAALSPHERLSAAQTAERLGCTPRNAADLAARGTLPAAKCGRAWTFDPVDVAEYVTARRHR